MERNKLGWDIWNSRVLAVMTGIIIGLSVISVLQHLMLASPLFEGRWGRLRSSSHMQRLMRLRIRVLDQFDQPATEYPIKVVITGVRASFVLFPGRGLKTRCLILKTDKDGMLVPCPDLIKISEAQLIEIDRERYAFKSNEGYSYSYTLFNSQYLAHHGDLLTFRVWRHDPPVHLEAFDCTAESDLGLDTELRDSLRDENTFSIDVDEKILSLDSSRGCVRVKVHQAKKAYAQYEVWRAFYLNWERSGNPKTEAWPSNGSGICSLEASGYDGWEIYPCPAHILAYVPKDRYDEPLRHTARGDGSGSHWTILARSPGQERSVYRLELFVKCRNEENGVPALLYSVHISTNPNTSDSLYDSFPIPGERQRECSLCP